MSNEIVQQVEELFSDKEQWESFLELWKQKNAIRDTWWHDFSLQMKKCFVIEHAVEGWTYTSWGNWDCRWYLTKYGLDSLCLWGREWGGSYSLSLWANSNVCKIEEISRLLQRGQENKYTPIVSAFDRLDFIGAENQSDKIIETGNFTFGGDSSDGNFDIDRLAWYAHYKPADLVAQMLAKVDRFRNPEVTSLLMEINEETKKQ
jgi:hypothetical protein